MPPPATPYPGPCRRPPGAGCDPIGAPTAIPAIHTDTAALAAHTVLPRTSPSIRIQTTWPIRAVAPEMKKRTVMSLVVDNCRLPGFTRCMVAEINAAARPGGRCSGIADVRNGPRSALFLLTLIRRLRRLAMGISRKNT